jgi:hypothetical protein
MVTEAKKNDISVDDGKLIVVEAASWKGTPSKLNGPGAIKGVGGDSSGTTQKIYAAAKCPYTYQTAHDFPTYALRSGVFRELGAGEQKQEGDILSWPNHMAIYSSFGGDLKNATTARTNKHGQKWTQRNKCGLLRTMTDRHILRSKYATGVLMPPECFGI